MMHLSKIKEKFAKTSRIGQQKDWAGIKAYVKRLRWKYEERKKYQKWIKIHQLTENKRREIQRQIESFERKPKISVVMPVYNVEERWLRLAIESVINQFYPNWELCIADDCSSKPHVRRVLEEYAAQDKRIKVVFRAENGHISTASNSALELASGEFTALLDHDDELTEDALYYIVKEINDFPDTSFIYTDEDMIDARGARYDPKFKPDFSRDFFYSLNYTTHLAGYRTEILRKIGGFRVGAEGSQDYDLALRVIEEINETQIRHIRRVLYHWRAIKGSVALASEEKPYAHERARESIRAHLERTGKKAIVSQSINEFHRVKYDLPENLPKTSLIISANEDFNAARRTIKNFTENTDYQNFEIVLIGSERLKNALDNESFTTETKIIVCEARDEAARLNFAAAQTSGEILCFVGANLKPLSADWLKELISFACQKEIGAVGAKLLSADEKILRGGLIIGTSETVSVA
ncbi:MAG TPA: glycosyltransferase, partial [Pyrinomonadaceae bacterium]